MRNLPALLGLTLSFTLGFTGSVGLPGPSGAGGRLGLELVRSAEARPSRHPVVHALLQDLAWVEAMNGERDDLHANSRIQNHIAAVRTSLLQSLARQQPLPLALQGAIGQLYAMAAINNRAIEADPEVGQRVAGAIEHMRARAEQVLVRIGRHAPPPRPLDYRPVVSAPPLVVPLPQDYHQQYAVTPPSPGWQQQQVPPPPDPWQQQPPPPGWQQQQQVPAPTGMPMAPAAFHGALAQMQRLSFSDEKVNHARDLVSSGNYFTCDQIAQLMRTASFSDDQIKIASTLYRNAVDPQNFIALTTSLTFESDRQKLRRLLGR